MTQGNDPSSQITFLGAYNGKTGTAFPATSEQENSIIT